MPEISNHPILSVDHLRKYFGNITALDGVSLDVYGGQVLALVGDNGAGKSTLIKIISGALSPDDGGIRINGRTYSRLSPAQALRNGITTVYQDLALVNCRDVPSNLFLGREPLRAGLLVDHRKMAAESRMLLDRLRVNIPRLDIPTGALSGGQRQALAVARAINQGGRVIILDEPTAAMGIQESTQVMELVSQLRDQGLAIILVSHNLHQVFSIADRVCVMRHGQLVADLWAKDTDPDQVVRLITGLEGGGMVAREVSEECLHVAMAD